MGYNDNYGPEYCYYCEGYTDANPADDYLMCENCLQRTHIQCIDMKGLLDNNRWKCPKCHHEQSV